MKTRENRRSLKEVGIRTGWLLFAAIGGAAAATFFQKELYPDEDLLSGNHLNVYDLETMGIGLTTAGVWHIRNRRRSRANLGS